MKTVLLKSLGPKQTINLFSDPVLTFHIWFVFSFFFLLVFFFFVQFYR